MATLERPPSEDIRRSIAWLTIANGIAKPLWFVFITAICMRGLGPAGYGELTVALALAGVAVAIAEMGTGEYATREIARRPEDASLLFVNLLSGRAVMAVLCFTVVIGGAYLLGLTATPVVALLAAGAYTVGLKGAEFCRAFYRAFSVLRYEAVSLSVERLLVMGTGVVGLVISHSAAGTLAGMSVGMLISFLLNLGWVHRRLARFTPALLDQRLLRRTYMLAAPIGLYYVFTMVLIGGGPVVLENIDGRAAAGEFGAASRLVEMLMLLPAVLCAVLLPRLSDLFHRGHLAGFKRLLTRAVLLLGGVSILIAVGLAAGAAPLLSLLAPSGDFAASVPLLRVVAWATPPMAIEMLVCFALIAADEQVFLAVATGLGALGHVILLLLATPALGGYAAGLSLIVSHLLIVGLAVGRLRRAVGRQADAPATQLSPHSSEGFVAAPPTLS
jgi:O-antigen/teichoic acid export membrane protein